MRTAVCRAHRHVLSLKSMFGDDAAILRDTNFQLLLLSTTLPSLGTSLLSPALDSLIDPFGASAANIGLMVSVFTAPAILVIPVAGVLADRYGRKPVLVASLLGFGVTGAAIAFTTDFRVVLALRLIQGACFGGTNPIIVTSIGDLYSGTEEATGQGLRFSGSGVTQTVFPLVSGVLVVVAWQYPFLLYALAVPIGVMVALWFDEPNVVERDARANGGGASGDGAGDDHGAAESYTRELFRLLRYPRVLALVAGRTLPLVVWIGFVTYNSIIVVRIIGGTPPQAGLLVAVASLASAIGGSQTGRITALFDSRYYPLVVSNLCMAAGFSVVLAGPGLAVATAGVSALGIGFGISLSLFRSVVTGLAPPDLRSGLVSVAESGGRGTATLAPVVMGAVIGFAEPRVGFTVAVQVAGVGAVVLGVGGGLLCLLVAHLSPPLPGGFTSG